MSKVALILLLVKEVFALECYKTIPQNRKCVEMMANETEEYYLPEMVSCFCTPYVIRVVCTKSSIGCYSFVAMRSDKTKFVIKGCLKETHHCENLKKNIIEYTKNGKPSVADGKCVPCWQKYCNNEYWDVTPFGGDRRISSLGIFTYVLLLFINLL